MSVVESKLMPEGERYLVARISSDAIGFSPRKVWCPSPSRQQRTEPYPVPKNVRMGTQDSEESGAKFTPPPFAVGVLGADGKVLVGVKAKRGWHVWNFVEFKVTEEIAEVWVDLEDHTSLQQAQQNISVFVMKGRKEEPPLKMLSRGMKRYYPSAFKADVKSIPSWWRRPIYNGYGDQVATSLMLEGPGREARSLAYCTQGLYERWIRRLEEAEVSFGTIEIDAGWSQGGVWNPNPIHWPNLRTFIENQHSKGRRVLLWVATWQHEGLPDSWCVWSGDVKLVADPTNPEYRSFLRKQVQTLLSPDEDGYNADGFKIDQLRYVPSEVRPVGGPHFGRTFSLGEKHARLRVLGKKWGCELLYQLQKDIYDAAKSVKPDALITSSTVHPYFHDTFDMVRLHDTILVRDVDVFTSMKARADLAKAVLPKKLIDADNWINQDYNQWLNYTLESHRLGVPCILYSERFVVSYKSEPTTLPIPLEDLCKIGRRWSELRY